MQSNNNLFDGVYKFDFYVGHAQLRVKAFLPPEADAVVALAYAGASEGAASYVCELAGELGHEGLGTIFIDCMPDGWRMDDFRSGLRRYLPGLLHSRLSGALGRISGHEALGSLPLGCLGLGVCAAPAIAATGPSDGFADAVVSIGGRPADAVEMADEISAPTLIVRDHAWLLEDISKERPLKGMFADATARVRVESAEPPFPDHRPAAQPIALAKNWFVDRLVPTPPPTPDLHVPETSERFGLPPMPSVAPDSTPRRAAR